MGDGCCELSCRSAYDVLFADPSLNKISSSASPICKDGIQSTFCDPQGDLFALMSD